MGLFSSDPGEELRKKYPYSTIEGPLGDKSDGGSWNWLMPHVDFKWKLTNKQTGEQEDVKVELVLPEGINMPSFDVPPYEGQYIRPVMDLALKYGCWYGLLGQRQDGQSFAVWVANQLRGNIYTFCVTGTAQTGASWYATYRDHDTLLVTCEEFNRKVMVFLAKFRQELEVAKQEFLKALNAEKSFLVVGGTYSGRIDVADAMGNWPAKQNFVFNCCNVKLDSVKAYSVSVNSESLLYASKAIADEAKKIREFTIERIDEKTLTIYVTSSDVCRLITLAEREIQEAKEKAKKQHPAKQFKERADKAKKLAGEFGNASVIIDGSNVVRYSSRFGWRVLRTLLLSLKKINLRYFVYFDSTIGHLEMDDQGKAFIQSLLHDMDHTAKCPSREEADKFILYRAEMLGAHVVSNDGYKQWDEQYPWIAVKNNEGDIRRVHKFCIEGEVLSIPDFGIYETIEP